MYVIKKIDIFFFIRKIHNISLYTPSINQLHVFHSKLILEICPKINVRIFLKILFLLYTNMLKIINKILHRTDTI